jgi:multicomponent Na+:H+ antiporter subunit E
MLLAASALISLFVFWILLSGYFTTFLLLAGVGCSLAVVLLARRMGILDIEGHPVTMLPRALPYTAWLVKEMVKSAWVVSKIILHPKLPISPTLVRFRPTQRTVVGLVTHANSITLTPGTITMQAEPDQFLVHALTREGAEGAASGEMDARVSTCEGRP